MPIEHLIHYLERKVEAYQQAIAALKRAVEIDSSIVADLDSLLGAEGPTKQRKMSESMRRVWEKRRKAEATEPKEE